jgi:hypothetical protein
LYSDDYETLYPLLNVKTADDVTEHLSGYIENKEKYKAEAATGSKWLLEHTVQYPLDIIKKTIENKLPNSTELPLAEQSNGLQVLKNHRRKDKQLRLKAKLKNYFR